MTTNNLLDTVISENGLKNDSALARALGIKAPVISNMRAGRLALGATVIIRIHETFPIEIRRIKELAGLKSLERYVPPAEPEVQHVPV